MIHNRLCQLVSVHLHIGIPYPPGLAGREAPTLMSSENKDLEALTFIRDVIRSGLFLGENASAVAKALNLLEQAKAVIEEKAVVVQGLENQPNETE